MQTPLEPVAHLLPHSGRMVMIDRLLHYDAHSAVTESDVDARHIFAENGVLPAWAFLEIMAQAIGVLVGALAEDAGEPIRLGFLLGTRKLTLHHGDLPLPATLRSEIQESTQDQSGFGVFDCRLYCGTALLADAALNVYMPPEGADGVAHV